MEKIILYLFLLLVFIIMTIKNIGLIRRNSQAKKCNDYCQALLNKQEGAYEQLVGYINQQKDEMFANKARIFLLYDDVNTSKFEQTLSKIELRPLFYNKGHFDKKLFMFNTDAFIWLSLIMCKAYRVGSNKVYEKVIALFEEMKNDFDDYLEYSVFLLGIKNVFLNKDDSLARIITENQQNDYKLNPKYLDLYLVICEMILVGTNMLKRSELVDIHIKSFVNSKLGQLFANELQITIDD